MAEDSGAGLMSQKEAQRYAVIEQVLQGHASQALAAQQLGLSVRQIKRLCAGVRQHGTGALISRRRGQPSNRRISAARKSAIMAIVASKLAPGVTCWDGSKGFELPVSELKMSGTPFAPDRPCQ